MKTILLTFSATLAAVSMAGYLFLTPLLGAFGLAATSIDRLQELVASKQIVDRVKRRHQQKRLVVSKKFARKSSRRVASTALAAVTVGTVAVAVTTMSLEVADYCEEKAALQEEANILYGTDDTVDMERCFEEGKQDSKALFVELRTSSADAVSNAFEATANYSAEKWDAVWEWARVWLSE